MTALLLFSLIAASQEQSRHPCDVIQRNVQNVVDGKPAPLLWNPLLGAAVNLFFCGPNKGERVSYSTKIDGVAVESPGLLSLDHLEAAAYPDYQTAGRNGLVPYVGPGSFIVLKTPGKHTVEVTYGPDNTVVSFEWIGATCADPKWPGDSPLGVPTINCR